MEKLNTLDKKDEARKLTETADRIAIKYILANFRAWKASGGKELLKPAGNQAWNHIAIQDLLSGLTPKARENMASETN